MEICDGTSKGRHDEIVHDGGECPMCLIREKAESANDELTKATRLANDLRTKIGDAVRDTMMKYGLVSDSASAEYKQLMEYHPTISLHDARQWLEDLDDVHSKINDLDIDLD